MRFLVFLGTTLARLRRKVAKGKIAMQLALWWGRCRLAPKTEEEGIMKRTLLTMALMAAAGTAGAQTVTPPTVGGATVTPPAVGGATVTPPPIAPQSVGTPGITPPAAGAPAVPSQSVGAGGATVTTPPVSGSSVNPPAVGSGGVATPGINAPGVSTPGVNPPSVSTPGINAGSITAPNANTANLPQAPNAAGSANIVTKIEADGYKNVQGLTRGADGKWRGKALRGSTMVDVVVDAAGRVAAE
jgi:hypothetical protein